MGIKKHQSLLEGDVADFLDSVVTPMRLAVTDGDGYPVVCSLWFIRDGDCLWAACHKNAYLIKVLRRNIKAGFDISTNDSPYQGVRGQADIELHSDENGQALGQLIKRYLGDSNKQLKAWLLSRQEDEYAIRIVPRKISSWDFSNRMDPPEKLR